MKFSIAPLNLETHRLENSLISHSSRRMTAVAAALFLSTVGRPAPGLADTKSDARTAADRWDQAYDSGDVEGPGKLYTPDATVIPKGAPVNGAGIQSFLAGLKAKGFDSHETIVDAATPKDDLMVLTGR